MRMNREQIRKVLGDPHPPGSPLKTPPRKTERALHGPDGAKEDTKYSRRIRDAWRSPLEHRDISIQALTDALIEVGVLPKGALVNDVSVNLERGTVRLHYFREH